MWKKRTLDHFSNRKESSVAESSQYNNQSNNTNKIKNKDDEYSKPIRVSTSNFKQLD